MLTRLRFKNWRSLRDVTIDNLKPITVFIGANSSGKTNIVDGLYFLRDGVATDPFDRLKDRGWESNVHTIGINKAEDLTLELSFRISEGNSNELTYTLTEKNNIGMQPNGQEPTYWFDELLTDSDRTVWLQANNGPHQYAEVWDTKRNSTRNEPNPTLGLLAFGRLSAYRNVQHTFQFITQRWQLLDEGFAPSLSFPTGQATDWYMLDRCAHNLSVVLEFMHRKHPELYAALQDDAHWLLQHVESLHTEQTERETRLYIKETQHPDVEAPIISAGTGRMLAMLTAFYALDMRSPEMPGLVVIEEPDTALNPGVLRNFAEQLRYFTTGEHPRQVIMTTHNPRFLDYFEPEEVRVVERDEQGYTTVNPIPDSVREIWLDKYALGEVWMTNSFGALAE